MVIDDEIAPREDGEAGGVDVRALADAASRTPIVGISGRTEIGDEQAARAAGMDFYLHKPVSPSALSESIAAVLPATT